MYQTTQYAVNVATGAVDSGTLVSNTWYDAAGNVIKSQPAGSQEFTKTAYDGLGRPSFQCVGYDTDETVGQSGSYTEAADLSDNLIFQETQTAYDAAGNTLLTTTYQRLPTASDSDTGPLDQLSGDARVTYTAAWQDGLGRQIVTADYGTNAGTAMTLSTRPAAPPVWSGGTWTGTGAENGAIVSGTAYDAAGRPWQTTDPNGIVSQTLYDAAGRTVETIQNYVDGDPATGTPDQDVTTETTYTPDGQVATYTAVDATANTSGPNTLTPEVTTYVYGSDLGAAGEGFIPLVHDNDLLRAVIYPDSQNTPADVAAGSAGTGGYNRVEYQYDRQGEEVQTEDQNQTVHDYIFDQLGRQTEDEVTQFGTGIYQGADAVDTILQSYDLLGDLQDVKSVHGGPTGTVLNEVFRQYNDLGMLTREYQKQTAGTIAFGNDGNPNDGTPYVQYDYDRTVDANGQFAKGLRPPT